MDKKYWWFSLSLALGVHLLPVIYYAQIFARGKTVMPVPVEIPIKIAISGQGFSEPKAATPPRKPPSQAAKKKKTHSKKNPLKKRTTTPQPQYMRAAQQQEVASAQAVSQSTQRVDNTASAGEGADTAAVDPNGVDSDTKNTGSGSASGLQGNAELSNIWVKYVHLLSRRIERSKFYPLAARENREQGIVEVQVTIARDGRILAKRIVKHSGSKYLDQAALETLAKAEPLPKIPQEIDVPFVVILPIQYTLKGS